MPTAVRQKADFPAYSDSWGHISDELQRLDLRLRLQVLKQPLAQASDPLSPFKGLVVTRCGDFRPADFSAGPEQRTCRRDGRAAEAGTGAGEPPKMKLRRGAPQASRRERICPSRNSLNCSA